MHKKGIITVLFIILISILASASLFTQQKKTLDLTDPSDPLLNQGPKKEAIGDLFMVSTQLASSTMAAVEVLENGGNAVDAALTALFVQQVHGVVRDVWSIPTVPEQFTRRPQQLESDLDNLNLTRRHGRYGQIRNGLCDNEQLRVRSIAERGICP